MAAEREPPAEARLLIGAITGAHGLRGQVKIKSFTSGERDARLFAQASDEQGRVLGLAVAAARAPGELIATLAGVADRDAAQALKGTRLYVARAALPAPGAEEYYHADLIGLAAERADGAALGTVRAVHDFGAGGVVEIAGARGTMMVPFTRAAVPVVDLARRRIVVEPPPGLPGFEDEEGSGP